MIIKNKQSEEYSTINDNIDSKKEVVKNYKAKDFKKVEQKCNDELYDFLDTKK